MSGMAQHGGKWSLNNKVRCIMDLKDKYKQERESFENTVKKRDFLENELQNILADILERKGRLELLEELIAAESDKKQDDTREDAVLNL